LIHFQEGHDIFSRLPKRRVLTSLVLGSIPWLPAVGFESATFWAGVALRGDIYGLFSGTRLQVDIGSFLIGGILVSRLVRPRLALFQAALNTMVFWVFLYAACFTFISPNGFLHSSCYQVGPDGLEGYRLGLFMFSLEAFPILLTLAEKYATIPIRIRPLTGIFAGILVATMTSWFPLTAWFSGVVFFPFFEIFQVLVLFGVPALAVGMLVARISRSVEVAALSGLASILFLSVAFWTLPCTMCDRSIMLLTLPSWTFFSMVGGFLELDRPLPTSLLCRSIARNIPAFRTLAVALVIVVTLSPALFQPYWDPSLIYIANTSSQANSQLVYGLPAYRPYIAGYYDSLQYRICCLEVGVSFTNVDTSRIGPGNYLMAGIGVQSPNCCVDGWDLGWRADAYILGDGQIFVSADTWGTCDGNANCGGHFWQNPRYHSQTVLSLPDPSTPIHLRMMWESGIVNWYYNYTGIPWQKYGSFTPDFREGRYFDIGVVLGGRGNPPYQDAFFYQFGVSSKVPVSGWTVRLLYPSFMYQGVWRLMEKARTIQGDHSYWKANYRWGGYPYLGVWAKGNALDSSIDKNVVEFSYTGDVVMPERILLWA